MQCRSSSPFGQSALKKHSSIFKRNSIHVPSRTFDLERENEKLRPNVLYLESHCKSNFGRCTLCYSGKCIGPDGTTLQRKFKRKLIFQSTWTIKYSRSYHTGSHRNNPSNRRCHRKFCVTGIVHAESRSKCNSARPIRHDSRSFDCIAPTPTRTRRSYTETDRRNL